MNSHSSQTANAVSDRDPFPAEHRRCLVDRLLQPSAEFVRALVETAGQQIARQPNAQSLGGVLQVNS